MHVPRNGPNRQFFVRSPPSFEQQNGYAVQPVYHPVTIQYPIIHNVHNGSLRPMGMPMSHHIPRHTHMPTHVQQIQMHGRMTHTHHAHRPRHATHIAHAHQQAFEAHQVQRAQEAQDNAQILQHLDVQQKTGGHPLLNRLWSIESSESQTPTEPQTNEFDETEQITAGPNILGQQKSGSNMPTNEECGIRDVWHHNLEEEFKTIRIVVQQFPFIAMDTEFPGVVARPIGEFRTTADYQYQLLRCNVDLLKIIQLGLTFYDESGNMPRGFTTWQFNFKFSLTDDMFAQDSIDMLQNSGIQFKKHEEEGIEPLVFAELLMSSGVVLVEDVKWLSFHSGYDFGYLLKLLTDQNLPENESEFFEILRLYFPTIYDVKYLMKSCKNLKGGLQEVAEELDIQRVGPQHQAGSDALLTGMVFFKMREMFFEDNIDDAKYAGHLYGLGSAMIFNGSAGYIDTNGDNSTST
ncbi:hypothetical protein TKK_0000638 [Trichogramma kaykai]